MAIVNATPDSYVSTSRKESLAEYYKLISTYIEQGANIIDIGAQSTRPNAGLVSENEEWQRLEPVLELVATSFPHIIVSIDSFYSSVIEKSAKYNIHIANDISFGQFDSNMKTTVANLGLIYIGMHNNSSFEKMHTINSELPIIETILNFFETKVAEFENAGVKNIILDPGFGFGKTLEQNYSILKNLGKLKKFRKDILVGISRKSMIQKVLEINTENALNATTALHMIALQNGAKILRVHDVIEAKQTIDLWKYYSSVH